MLIGNCCQEREFLVPSRYKHVVQTTRYKKSPYTVRSIMKTSGIRPHIVKLLCKSITRECKLLSSQKSSLKYVSAKAVKTFKWKAMENEMKAVAPTLLAILRSAIIKRSSPPDMRKVCMAAALLLKARNKNMCLVQSFVSVLLYAGHCSKLVSHNCDASIYIHVYQVQCMCILTSVNLY